MKQKHPLTPIDTNSISMHNDWYWCAIAYRNTLIGEAVFFGVSTTVLITPFLLTSERVDLSGLPKLFDKDTFLLTYCFAMFSPFLAVSARWLCSHLPLPGALKTSWEESCKGTVACQRIAGLFGAFLGIAAPLIAIGAQRLPVTRFCIALCLIAAFLWLTVPAVVAFLHGGIREFSSYRTRDKLCLILGFALLISPLPLVGEKVWFRIMIAIFVIEGLVIAAVWFRRRKARSGFHSSIQTN